MKTIRKLLLAVLALLAVCVLTGCGAKVSSDMTVSKDFAGSREIVLDIASDDLEKVEGGIKALEKIIKADIPDEMTYKINHQDDGSEQIVFTITFEDLEGYREKITTILDAGVTEEEEENKIVPEIRFEYSDTYFKKGVVFQENFNNVDLVDWFREGIREAGIITESESNWSETADSIVTIEGVEYTNYGTYSVDSQETTCLNGCDVTTTINLDNTIDRVIVFTAYEETVTALSDKGCELETYLKDFAPKGSEFVAEKDENGNYTYTFTLHAADAKDLVKQTNTVMQTSGNKFATKVALDKKKLGIATVSVTEAIDASFYMNYGGYYSNPVVSRVYVYENASLMTGPEEVSYYSEESGVSYRPLLDQSYTFAFDWEILFEDITFDVKSEGSDKVSVIFDCKLGDSLTKEMKQSAIDRVKSFVAEKDVCKASDDGVKLTFTGEPALVQSQLNATLRAASGNANDETEYVTLKKLSFSTASLFTDGVSYQMDYDFSPLFKAGSMKFEESEGLLSSKYFQGSINTDEEGEKTLYLSGSVAVYEISPAVLFIILAVVFLLLAVGGIVLGVLNIKSLLAYIAVCKERKAQAPAVAAAPVAAPQEANEEASECDEAPVAPVAAPVAAPAAQEAATDDEEEDIL